MTPQKPMDMMIFQPECSRRLRWVSLQLWQNCSTSPSDLVNYRMNGKSLVSHPFPKQTSIQTLEATVQYHCYQFWVNFLRNIIIHNILLAPFEEHHPISTQQWGLTCGKSTTGALLDATDQWFRELEQGHDICTVFLTIVKLLIQFHTGPYCKSFKIMVYTNRSSDGLHIIFARARNMSV